MFGKRKVRNQIEKLSLEQGDVIVLRTNKGFQQWVKFLGKLVERIKETKNITITALVLPEEFRFGSLSENEMNNAGWFRQDTEEVSRILEDNEMLHKWNAEIKKLHVDDALKNYEIIEDLKEKLKKYEEREG